MYKKRTKKQLLIRRIILSVVATISVLIIVTVTILFMLGYRLDSGNGRLEQGALLQFDSTPNGADVAVDGKNIGRTANKYSVLAGTHSVKMTREGYRDWNRTLELQAGTLTWLDYARLVPKELPVQNVATYPSLAAMKMSPDFRWAIAQEVPETPAFKRIDLRSETVSSTDLVIPPALYTDATTEGVSHSFTITDWDEGSRYLLVKHIYNDKTEWIVLDTQDIDRTINVSQLLSVGFRDVQFAGTDGRTLFALTDDGTVRTVDVAGATISRALVAHVESFNVFDNNVISYVGTDPADASKKVAGVYRDGDEAPHILRRTAAADTPLRITTGRYFSDDYVAIAEGSLVTVLKGSYPSSSSQDTSSLRRVTTLELPGTVSALSFSPSGDYVLAQSGSSFMSYEVEHRFSAAGTIITPENTAASTLKWLDNAHLWNDDGGTLTMRDYNGVNLYSIMKVTPGFDASLSQNGRFFYGVGQTDKGFRLQRVEMIIQ